MTRLKLLVHTQPILSLVPTNQLDSLEADAQLQCLEDLKRRRAYLTSFDVSGLGVLGFERQRASVAVRIEPILVFYIWRMR